MEKQPLPKCAWFLNVAHSSSAITQPPSWLPSHYAAMPSIPLTAPSPTTSTFHLSINHPSMLRRRSINPFTPVDSFLRSRSFPLMVLLHSLSVARLTGSVSLVAANPPISPVLRLPINPTAGPPSPGSSLFASCIDRCLSLIGHFLHLIWLLFRNPLPISLNPRFNFSSHRLPQLSSPSAIACFLSLPSQPHPSCPFTTVASPSTNEEQTRKVVLSRMPSPVSGSRHLLDSNRWSLPRVFLTVKLRSHLMWVKLRGRLSIQCF